jgi:PLD-like domain
LIGEAAKQIDMAAYVLTDRAVVEALRQAAVRGVKVRIWRDASEAVRLNEFDVEAQLGGWVQGLGLKSSEPGSGARGSIDFASYSLTDGAVIKDYSFEASVVRLVE